MRHGMPPPKRLRQRTEAQLAKALPSTEVTVEGIEVTQVIQDMEHSVTLIAGKPTVVRLYLNRKSGAALTVRGEISVRRKMSGPASNVPSLDAVRVGTEMNGRLREKREDLRLSLNFLLPESLTTEGHVFITLALLTNVATGEEVSFLNPADEVRRVHFKESPPLRIRLIKLRYKTKERTHAPSERDAQLIKSWLTRAYPASRTIFSERMVEANIAPPFDEEEDTCNLANAQLAAIRNLDIDGGIDQRVHYYGMVADSAGFMRGCANQIPTHADPTAVASGPTGPGGYAWDTDGSYGDWYGAHELGHTFGRFHPGFCNGNSGDDPRYPFERGQLSDSDGAFVGLDIGEPSLGIPMRALPGASWHDVMTYCTRQWISSYTYEGIRRRLAAEDALGPTPHVAASAPEARTTAKAMEVHMATGQFINVIGTVNLTKRTGKILYVNPVTSALVPAHGEGEVEVRVKSADDAELDTFPVRVKINTCSDRRKERTGIIDMVVPFNPEARALELLIDGHVVDTYRAQGEAAPEVKNLRKMKTRDEALAFEWEETKAQTAYNVQVSTDEGQTWQTVAVGRTTPDVEIDRNQFPHDTNLVVRVIATDGFTSHVVTTETFSVSDDDG